MANTDCNMECAQEAVNVAEAPWGFFQLAGYLREKLMRYGIFKSDKRRYRLGKSLKGYGIFRVKINGVCRMTRRWQTPYMHRLCFMEHEYVGMSWSRKRLHRNVFQHRSVFIAVIISLNFMRGNSFDIWKLLVNFSQCIPFTSWPWWRRCGMIENKEIFLCGGPFDRSWRNFHGVTQRVMHRFVQIDNRFSSVARFGHFIN